MMCKDLWPPGRDGKRGRPSAKWPGMPGHRAPHGIGCYLMVGPFWPPWPPVAPSVGIVCRIGAVLARNGAALPTVAVLAAVPVLPADEPPDDPPALNTLRPPLPRPIT